MVGEAHTTTQGLAASILAAGVSTAGLISLALLGDWGRRASPYFSAFAIGILSVAVLLHLLPEALSYNPNAWKAFLGGFATMATIGLVLRMIAQERSNGVDLAFGYASIIALGFHSFLDGVVYETTFHGSEFTGWISAVGLLLHEFPEGVIAYYLLYEAGLSVRSSLFLAFVASSLTTIVGAAATGYAHAFAPAIPLGMLLGGSAGALGYIMAFHLGPHAQLTPEKRGYAVASIGVVIATAAILVRHTDLFGGGHVH